MLMHYAGHDFEDIRIPRDQWPSVKPTMPGGSMPVLEFPDGRKMGQTCSLLRYLGKVNGLYPRDATVAVQCDILNEDYNDAYLPKIGGSILAAPEKQKEAILDVVNNILPPFMDRVEKLCSKGNKYLFGNELCTADFFVGGHLYVNVMANPILGQGMAPDAKEAYAGLAEKYPNFKAYGERLTEANAKYLNTRGPSPI